MTGPENPDVPRFDPVDLAVQEIADGGMVVVVDDEDREDEGDLVMAAAHVRTPDTAFMVRYGSGVVCVALPGERCDALDLPSWSARATPSSRARRSR